MALLAYSGLLAVVGCTSSARLIAARVVGYGALAVGILYFLLDYLQSAIYLYDSINATMALHINLLFALLFTACAAWYLLLRQCAPRVLHANEKNMYLVMQIGAALTGLAWGRFAIAWWMSSDLVPFGHAMYADTIFIVWYTLYAVALIFIGLMRDERPFRYLGLIIIAGAVFKTFGVIMSFQNTLHRIVALIVAGVVLTFASFLYQRLSRK